MAEETHVLRQFLPGAKLNKIVVTLSSGRRDGVCSAFLDGIKSGGIRVQMGGMLRSVHHSFL